MGDKIGTESTAILNLMLRNKQIADKVSPQGVGFDFAYFLQNANVVYPVYLNEEPMTARIKGVQVTEIDPASAENGSIRLYGNVIIAHKYTVSGKEQVVRAFVSAIRKGWEFAKE